MEKESVYGEDQAYFICGKQSQLRVLYTEISFFLFAQQPPVDQGLLIHKVFRSHTTTQQSR